MEMEEFETIKFFSGHSGCETVLLKDKNANFFVRKTSPAPAYSKRLKNQCTKQELFRSPIIGSPQILRKGFRNGCYYFDMEYIPARSLAHHIDTLSNEEIAELMTQKLQIAAASHDEMNQSGAREAFENKIRDLKEKTAAHENLGHALEVLTSFDWNRVPRSPCHGDLTLENILVTQEKSIYLIDFLDSFFDSWMIDIAKLLQDLELGWSFRHNIADGTRNLKLAIAKKALIGKLKQFANGPDIIEAIYHVLLLNTLRIYPYTKDRSTFDFLNRSTARLLQLIERKGYL